MWIKLLVVVFLIICVVPSMAENWVKGNTHTHTTESDGDSPPEVVADWYKTHGYNFLVLSDHNVLTDSAKYDADPMDNFILIPGEEVTTKFDSDYVHQIHVNALGIKEVIKPVVGYSVTSTLQNNINEIVKLGGLPHINHPNFRYGIDYKDLAQVKGCNLIEICNAHPRVDNAGDSAHISVEQMWDILLSQDREIYGIASDDAHHFKEFDQTKKANPGHGWIMVQVNKLTQQEVLDNIRKGNFYASTGVELADYLFDGKTLHISISPTANIKYVTRFIGKYGQILGEINGLEATYKFTGSPSEAYIRAKIISSDGKVAWTQPVRQK